MNLRTLLASSTSLVVFRFTSPFLTDSRSLHLNSLLCFSLSLPFPLSLCMCYSVAIIAHFSIRGTRTFVSTSFILDTLGKWELYWINRRRMHFHIERALPSSHYWLPLLRILIHSVIVYRRVFWYLCARKWYYQPEKWNNSKSQNKNKNKWLSVSFIFSFARPTLQLGIVYSFLWLFLSHSTLRRKFFDTHWYQIKSDEWKRLWKRESKKWTLNCRRMMTSSRKCDERKKKTVIWLKLKSTIYRTWA